MERLAIGKAIFNMFEIIGILGMVAQSGSWSGSFGQIWGNSGVQVLKVMPVAVAGLKFASKDLMEKFVDASSSWQDPRGH